MSVFRPLALPLSAVCVNRQTINYAFAFSYKKFALFELADSMRRKILFSCYCRMKQGYRLADLERTAEFSRYDANRGIDTIRHIRNTGILLTEQNVSYKMETYGIAMAKKGLQMKNIYKNF